MPADADCVMSIEYNSALLNHVSKTGMSCDENIPIISFFFQINYNRSYFVLPAHPNFLTRDLVTLNYNIDVLYRYHAVRICWLPDPNEMPKMVSLLAIAQGLLV